LSFFLRDRVGLLVDTDSEISPESKQTTKQENQKKIIHAGRILCVKSKTAIWKTQTLFIL
jgi:hypothetical protein